MYLETVSGAFIEVSKHYIENAPRHQLIEYLEMRGTACFDNESTDMRCRIIEEMVNIRITRGRKKND